MSWHCHISNPEIVITRLNSNQIVMKDVLAYAFDYFGLVLTRTAISSRGAIIEAFSSQRHGLC